MVWRNDVEVQPDRTVHVYPVADLIAHDIGAGGVCACGPFLEEQVNGNVLVVHHSLDGRERFE